MTYVYRCYDEGNSLLYIGCSDYPEYRIKSHQRTKWGKKISRFKQSRSMTRDAALKAERRAIERERPLYNMAQMVSPTRVPRGFRIKDSSKDWCVRRRLKILAIWKAGYGPAAIGRGFGFTCGCASHHINKAIKYLRERRYKQAWKTRRANGKPRSKA